ncbi:putative lactobacillus shifted protein [Clavispora lusitaniae]|uniref:Lactobacillus shifted protein n=1 Tax=Clavispora lusitaniae TaxID=36911 RepID=A0AA91PY57_CLALS|nr:putative lactobacillus shifted protein [Clavispora lusitaniae]
MLSRSLFRSTVRYQTTVAESVKSTVTGLTREELAHNKNALQAPNRPNKWSPSQEGRAEVIARNPQRFIQKDLSAQPQPYAAIELIAKQPIMYLSEGNIAVCDGNKGSTLQGHPKVYINLDKPEAATCGYCGLRYAKEAHREHIEKK